MKPTLKTAASWLDWRAVRRVVVAIAGGAMVLLGIVMLFLPGPALLVIPAGFGILALEFEGARKWSAIILKWVRRTTAPKNLKRILHENSLSLVMFLLFGVCLGGQMVTGHWKSNEERLHRGQSELPFREYLTSGEAIEATFENWESEFLQMGALVLLTVWLRQKGAPDSHALNSRSGDARDPTPESPWPVHRGGWILRIYKHSLSLCLFGLFLGSFFLHAVGGSRAYLEEAGAFAGNFSSVGQYMATSRFWFESLQNWQSEFLSVGVLLVLSIFLREKGSPQSKAVEAPHSETGGEPVPLGNDQKRKRALRPQNSSAVESRLSPTESRS